MSAAAQRIGPSSSKIHGRGDFWQRPIPVLARHPDRRLTDDYTTAERARNDHLIPAIQDPATGGLCGARQDGRARYGGKLSAAWGRLPPGPARAVRGDSYVIPPPKQPKKCGKPGWAAAR